MDRGVNWFTGKDFPACQALRNTTRRKYQKVHTAPLGVNQYLYLYSFKGSPLNIKTWVFKCNTSISETALSNLLFGTSLPCSSEEGNISCWAVTKTRSPQLKMFEEQLDLTQTVWNVLRVLHVRTNIIALVQKTTRFWPFHAWSSLAAVTPTSSRYSVA